MGGAGGATGGAGGGAGGLGGMGGMGGSVPACPDTGYGPAMVMISAPDPADDFCIDSTEVTVSDYKEFLDAMVDPMMQNNECKSWNNTFDAATFGNACDLFNFGQAVMNEPERPMVCVDFCDAHTYCKWAGKRLCGKIGGAKLGFNSTGDAAQSQWYRACSDGGLQSFPYGNTFEAQSCVGNEFDGVLGYNGMTDYAHPAGSTATCEGSVPGLFDMSGNVWEWEDACNGTNGIGDNCIRRGGSYFVAEIDLPCTSASAVTRESAFRTTGFRCCADLP